MKPFDSKAVLDNLSWRYATKKFDTSHKMPEATWAALQHSMVLAPSSYGLQPWKFLVVVDKAIRKQLREVAYNQPQITDASYLVVLARKKVVTAEDVGHYIERIASVRGVSKESLSGFRDAMLGTIAGLTPEKMDVWTSRQVYIALGFFLSTAAMLGVDACPMEGFDAAKFDQILGLEHQGLAATVVAAAGFRAADDPVSKLAKVRFSEAEVVVRV